ncbi:MAG TPA: hypothetical protein VN213_07165 [Solirubrobacteraceae bacterium]|nr:hypothetical protein [Solirubrobacteraceae bacterium]
MGLASVPFSLLSAAAAPRSGPPLWRQLFDAVERPLATASEAWVQTETFMDALAVTYRAQRRVTSELARAVQGSARLWGMPTRDDVTALVNQVAGLERKVRELELQLERER